MGRKGVGIMRETCYNCKYAMELLGGNLRCYRFPPNTRRSDIEMDTGDIIISYVHVPVNPNDWCGEWKQKE
jgi:hypothetical protein